MLVRIGVNRSAGETDRPPRNRSFRAHASWHDKTEQGHQAKAQSCQPMLGASRTGMTRDTYKKPQAGQCQGGEGASSRQYTQTDPRLGIGTGLVLCSTHIRCRKRHSPTSRRQLPRQAAVREIKPTCAKKHKPSVRCIQSCAVHKGIRTAQRLSTSAEWSRCVAVTSRR